MDRERLISLLPDGSLFARNILTANSLSSTNDRLKELAAQGAPEGTVLLAEEQTAGRGTRERSFFSPRGEGLYLSLLLRPRADLQDLLTLTGRTAVAVREGIEAATGAPAAIKWLNDIYLNGRKICGILAEFSPAPDPFVVMGIGIDTAQSPDTFRAQGLDGIASSLAAEGYPVSRHALAAAVLAAMEEMYRRFPGDPADYVARYRVHCLTIGRRVAVGGRTGVAEGIAPDFSLLVREDSGLCRAINAGDVIML